eukprot:11527764-Karenia_brevis.AAC.1
MLEKQPKHNSEKADAGLFWVVLPGGPYRSSNAEPPGILFCILTLQLVPQGHGGDIYRARLHASVNHVGKSRQVGGDRKSWNISYWQLGSASLGKSRQV